MLGHISRAACLLTWSSLLTAGCGDGATVRRAAKIMFEGPDAGGYRLVAAYDATSLRGAELLLPEEERPAPYDYLWKPSGKMEAYCGIAKAPDGLRIFEAEAMANRMMPALALVIERQGDVPELGPQNLRVALGEGQPEFFLQPGLSPRYLRIDIDIDIGSIPEQELGGLSEVEVRRRLEEQLARQVQTQFETYLCMEHKTGRAWQGGDADEIRQALLLDAPDSVRLDENAVRELPDRKYFGGQKAPVAALAGPPDACFDLTDLEATAAILTPPPAADGKGEVDVVLVPSDVWGAKLRACDPALERHRSRYRGPRPVTMTMSAVPAGPADLPMGSWSTVRVAVDSPSSALGSQRVSVSYFAPRDDLSSAGTPILDDIMLYPNVEKVRSEGREPTAADLGLVDLVSKIPWSYPAVGDGENQRRYSVLLIPNWQLNEGIRRMERRAAHESDAGEACDARGLPSLCASLATDRVGLTQGQIDAEVAACQADYKEICSLQKAMPTSGFGIQDGVGWILEQPEHLFVLVPDRLEDAGLVDLADVTDWQNLASVMYGGDLGLADWGFMTGLQAGRAPIALAGSVEPTWSQVMAAQRAREQAMVLGAVTVLMVFLLLGLVRVRDLWVAVPTERVEFWPGPPPEDGEDEGDDMGELASGGEDEA